MKKLLSSLILTILIFVCSVQAWGQRTTPQRTPILSDTDSLKVSLLFPEMGTHRYHRQKKMRIKYSPVIVKGTVPVEVIIAPESGRHKGDKGYIISCYVDNKLVHWADKVTENKEGSLSFVWSWETTEYANGKHTLIINLEDGYGNIAIDRIKIIIKNEPQRQEGEEQ